MDAVQKAEDRVRGGHRIARLELPGPDAADEEILELMLDLALALVDGVEPARRGEGLAGVEVAQDVDDGSVHADEGGAEVVELAGEAALARQHGVEGARQLADELLVGGKVAVIGPHEARPGPVHEQERGGSGRDADRPHEADEDHVRGEGDLLHERAVEARGTLAQDRRAGLEHVPLPGGKRASPFTPSAPAKRLAIAAWSLASTLTAKTPLPVIAA